MRIVSMNNVTLQWIDSLVNGYGQSEEAAVAEIGLGIGVLIGSIVLSVAVLCSLSVFRVKRFKAGRTSKMCAVFGFSEQTDEVVDEKENEREDPEDAKNSEEGGKNSQSVAGTEGAYRSDSDSEDEEESEKLSAVAQKRSRKAGAL
tara:strand:- start:3032 stop:3469 length:438 start_codon:yes stop_codon:yes gene_type:complete